MPEECLLPRNIPASCSRTRRESDARGRNQTLLGLAIGKILFWSDNGESQRPLSRGMASAVLHHQAGDRHKADWGPGWTGISHVEAGGIATPTPTRGVNVSKNRLYRRSLLLSWRWN